jgi:protein TIF31
VRLQVVFDPYDEYSSRYHEDRVRKILLNPVHWLVFNARDHASKNIEEEREVFGTVKLEQLFENPMTSNFLSFNEKKESDLGSIINSSGFNPPSISRKLLGDLYYLHLRTPEETDFHITANSEGFLVNQSNQGNFNPNCNPKYPACLSLLDLILQISPKFKARFQ